jgi:quinol monooxygenase YgiN
MNRFSNAVAAAILNLRLPLFFFSFLMLLGESVSAQGKNQIVRIAKLRIDSIQLEKYRAALQEEIETSIRVEPGVLTLYAVEEKKRPGYVTIFEVYSNEVAYRSHLETPHFKKYKFATGGMVKSLELIEMEPIVLAAKPRK